MCEQGLGSTSKKKHVIPSAAKNLSCQTLRCVQNDMFLEIEYSIRVNLVCQARTTFNSRAAEAAHCGLSKSGAALTGAHRRLREQAKCGADFGRTLRGRQNPFVF